MSEMMIPFHRTSFIISLIFSESLKQKVRSLGVSSLRTLSQEEKRFHWYILNNVDEILEYRKYIACKYNMYALTYLHVNNKRIWDVPEVDDVENEQLNVLKIVVDHRVDEHIKDKTLYRTGVDPIIVERPVVRHVTDDFIDDRVEQLLHQSRTSDKPRTMLSFPSGFDETDAMFLEFVEDLNNHAGGSSLMGKNLGELNGMKRAQSRLLELKYYVHANGRISMLIVPDVEKPILPHAIRFSQAIGVCVRNTFSVRCLKWTDIESNSRTPIPAYPDGSQPFSRDEICETMLGRRLGYSKGLGWGPKSKSCKPTSGTGVSTSWSQSMVELQLRVELDETKRAIEE
ncbi:CACTA en-spm transposon protein [Cucumis melo var. makuwa]|uniref:CACTA en-spm transposon protein n=1 Tax=Cucumis melo var. makuwa TaxID=1194695 RepID=A0A5A7TEQ7_CUCMM|nr:CACTA en-spm transposon protein [Cucumis melo var. makuwa]TYK17844.1 CACTA en-spm transposon protein [Cucumis melo var. makuwa]